MNSYLVTLISRETGDVQQIVVQSTCPHGMQEFVDSLTDLRVSHPVVVNIDRRAARHLPLVDPAP